MTLRRSFTAFLAALMSLAMVFGASLSAYATPVLVATIPTPANYPGYIVLSPDGKKLYAVDGTSPNLFLNVINSATNQVESTTALTSTSNYLAGLVISPDGSKLFLLDSNDSSIDIVNLSSGSPVLGGSIALPSANGAYTDLAISPNGQKIYATNGASGVNTVVVIDATSNTVQTSIPMPTATSGGLDYPRDVVVSPDSSIIYVSYYGRSSAAYRGIASFNAADNSLRNIVEFANTVSPYGLAISPDGQKLYMVNYQGSSASSIYTFNSPSTGFASGTNPAPIVTGMSNATRTALSADGSVLYVGSGLSGGGKIMIYDTVTMTSPTTITLPSNGLFSISPSQVNASHFAYVGSNNDVYLIGEYLSQNWQVLSGNTGTTLSSTALTATGISGTVAYSVAPALPSGFTLNTSTGVISGSSSAPLSAATYTITGTDGTTSAVATVSITVTDPSSSGGSSSSQLAQTGEPSRLPIAVIGLMFLFAGISLYSGSVALKRRATN